MPEFGPMRMIDILPEHVRACVLTELRIRDVDFPTRMLTVSRAVVEMNARFHPTGGRFLVKDYPKDKEYRRLKLTRQITDKLRAYAACRDLSDDDLVYAMPKRGPELTMLPNPDLLGRTEPNAAPGRRPG
jgi:hypothetical protein